MLRLTSVSLACSLFSLATPAQADGFGINATRLIYRADAGNIGVTVRNTQQQEPYLVQASVSSKQDSQVSAPFVVTPPIFRLEPQSVNQLRIAFIGASLPQDRESVFYFHATAIPASSQVDPHKATAGVQANVRFGVGSIIKLFYRPAGLPGTAASAQKGLQFRGHSGTLTVMNPSPYYISLGSLSLGGKKLSLDAAGARMLAPFAEHSWPVSSTPTAGCKVEWKTINDNGGTDAFTAALP